MTPGWIIRNRDAVETTQCPCGEAARVLTRDDPVPAGVHFVRIDGDAKVHYHLRTSETYIVLSGSGEMELDGERHPVREGDVVFIPPGTRHAAHGQLEIINVVCPPFDPDDEHLD